MNMIDAYNALPEIIVAAGICLALLVDVFIKQKNHLATFGFVQLVIIVAAAFTFLQLQLAPDINFAGSFIRDNFATVLKLFIYLTTFLSFYFAYNYLGERNTHRGEYYILGLFSMLGMMILTSAYSMLTVYLGLELLSLPIYAMIAIDRQSNTAAEAAMKFFVLGAIASGLMLYGMSMIFGAAHSLDIATIAKVSQHAKGLTMAMLGIGLVFIIVGVLFKLGAVPFHSWVPDVYQGAPLSVTLFVSTAPKIAALAMTVRVLVDMLPGLSQEWQLWLMVLAIASMAIGNVLAIAQSSIRRMLAYSSIAQMGYMLLGVLCATPRGYGAATFYMLSYALMSLAAFSLLTALSRRGIDIDAIDDLKGLNSRNPWLAFMMLLVMFSMAGVPPLLGFFTKVMVLEALIQAHFVWIACVALLLAVIGAYYYIRVVKVMYFDAPEKTDQLGQAMAFKISGGQLIIFSINSLALLVLGFLPGGLFMLCRQLF
ncbi:MAG: NADH-quinone oxidoreductase subunit NuoN [Pseudomonadota bacterium]